MTISESDFTYICRLLKDHSAIHLDPGKEYLVETRFVPLMKELGHETLASFVAWLRNNPIGLNHHRAVECLTTNETLFFRDSHPFDTFGNHLLPKLLERNISRKTLRIWSAACSTGQEPYTVEMILQEAAGRMKDWDVKILATDLSQNVLAKARDGFYNAHEISRGLPDPMLRKYFVQEKENWRVRPNMKDRIEFRQVNLVGAWPNVETMDLVFLRNVLIYFEPHIKKQIIGRISELMHPGSYLFLGGSETILGLSDGFRSHIIDKTVYYERL